MTCPYNASPLGRLPGKQPDDSARQLRRSFITGEVDIDHFLGENGYGFLRTKEARRANQIQTYATASIVIEQVWECVKSLPMEKIHQKCKHKYCSPVHEQRALNFIDFHLGLLEAIKRQVFAEAFDRHKTKTRTKKDDIFICFFAVGRRRSKTFRVPKHLKQELSSFLLPSMADLVTIFGRIAHIAPTVFQRDLGRKSTQEELFALLKQPYIMRLFVDMMTYDRKTLFPLLTKLEGTRRLDLNDTGRTFTPDCFMVSIVEERQVLHLRPGVVAEFRSAFERAADRRTRRGKPASAMLGCPALYTGKFREMFTWTAQCFEHWHKVAV